jgi:hypothetical protein
MLTGKCAKFRASCHQVRLQLFFLLCNPFHR